MPIQLKAFHNYETGYPNKHLIMDGDAFQRMMNFLEPSPFLIWDFETSGLEWFKHACACGLGLGAWDANGQIQSFYVPFRHQTGEPQLDINVIGPAFQKLLEDPRSVKIAHNIKFDEHMANREGWEVLGPRFDTMIAARLHNENIPMGLKFRASHDLKRTDADHLSTKVEAEVYRLAKQNRLPVKEYRDRYGYSQVEISLCGTYGCFDIDFTGGLYQHYNAAGVPTKYSRIWETEMELTGVLCQMERTGLPIDVDYLGTLRDALEGVSFSLEKEIEHQLGGYMFKLGSDDEMRNFLQHRLGLHLTALTKNKQLSVDREVLDSFADSHPVLKHIIKWREADKLHSTYTKSILSRLDHENILHTDFQQVGTFTGRLSCRQPNFQNQPSDNDGRAVEYSGKKLEFGGVDPWSIRRAYINRGPGWVRLFFDYSQIELRVIAFYSQDPVMVDNYLKGGDIHERTSLEVFGSIEKVWRRPSKVINFGISYGMTAMGLSRQAKMAMEDAEKYLDIFYNRYAGLKSFRQNFWNEVRSNGGRFQNLFGRGRFLPDIMSPTDWERERAERRAIATLIQGTASELTKESMVRISRFLKENDLPAYLVSTVHDEIQLDCHIEAMVPVCIGVKRLMEDFPEFSPIPVVVDGEYTTKSWADKAKLPAVA